MDAYTHWYTLQVPGWTLFSLQNCLNSSWHRFIKMLETFLRSFGQYWHESITVTADLLTTRHGWWCKWPITPHPKGALLNELLAVEAIWVQWIHCQIEEIRDSSSQATFFQFWWVCVNISHSFLFLAARNGVQCGPAEMLFCISCLYWVFFTLLLPPRQLEASRPWARVPQLAHEGLTDGMTIVGLAIGHTRHLLGGPMIYFLFIFYFFVTV